MAEIRSVKEELSRAFAEAKQQQSELAAALEIARQQDKEVAFTNAVAPLVEALLEPLVASIKRSIIPEVEEIGQTIVKDVNQNVEQLNAKVVSTVWEKVEKPLEAFARMTSTSNMKGARARVPSGNLTPRPVLPHPYLHSSGGQPSNSNGTQ